LSVHDKLKSGSKLKQEEPKGDDKPPADDDGMGFMSQKPKRPTEGNGNFTQTGTQSSAGVPIDSTNPMLNQ